MTPLLRRIASLCALLGMTSVLIISFGCSNESAKKPEEAPVTTPAPVAIAERPIDAELTKMAEASAAEMPILAEAGRTAAEELVSRGMLQQALQVGAKAPAFVLPDASGKPVSSEALLANGPIVLVFYRGAWCPYCNIYLRGLQRFLPEISAAGGQLVAVSGETPERSAGVVAADSLAYPVLSDTSLVVARQFGLAYEVPKMVDSIAASFGLDFKQYYKMSKSELPLSATYVIAKDGTISYAFLDANYQKRAEPSDLVAELKKLKM